MQILHVDLDDRSYPIYIGADLLQQAELLQQHVHGHQVLIVSNEIVAPLYMQQTLSCFEKFVCEQLILPDGEQYKTLDTVNRIFDTLLQHRFDRQCTLVALGGGVVGDITGFAAACYQRGVNFIQIPTTLLAQVDSSVGGKTGVNHPLAKNMIGAFYQPQCVIADTLTLNTLDDRQLSAGVAEIIKYGLIRDTEFFQWLEANISKLLQRDPTTLAYAIERSCSNKASIVAADEREAGIRALLNLGHTFGHAIEAGMGYGHWLHGEAVATGMIMAADLSQRLGWITTSDVKRLQTLLEQANLPVKAPAQMDKTRFLDLMAVDKKVIAGELRLVLLKTLNHAIITSEFDQELLHQTLEQTREHHATGKHQTR